MKKIVALLLLAAASFTASAQQITGAGATFPYPIYAKWAEVYNKETGVRFNYQSIGSSGGVRQITNKTVNFGASDAPVAGDTLDKLGLLQFPAILGGVVPIANLDGFRPGELRLTGAVLAEIYQGNILKWNDDRIAALNPGKTLPNQNITVVHRADGSGTTYHFTDYLATVSKTWADSIGKGNAVKWPAASSVGGKGNEGVAANVQRVKGAIGYVEYAYAKKNNMTHLQLKNRDGQYVNPNEESFAAAAADADWFSKPGMGISIIDATGAKSWPIAGASFILIYAKPADPKATAEVIKFFDWSFKNGKALASELDYVALPDTLTDQIRNKVWTKISK
jgi:phosphate transport system substrate-binding protein